MTFNPVPGAQIHALAAITISTSDELGSVGVVVERGQTVTLTKAMLDASRDRSGRSWIEDLVGNDAEQILRWGEVKVAPGAWPEGKPAWVQGDSLWEQKRAEARRLAWALEDPTARREALLAVQRDFGAAPKTSRTTNSRSDADRDERRAELSRYES